MARPRFGQFGTVGMDEAKQIAGEKGMFVAGEDAALGKGAEATKGLAIYWDKEIEYKLNCLER
jgi:hypothetical protein